MVYLCSDERRATVIREYTDLNGLAFLEVLDGETLPVEERQRTLYVHFIKDPSGLELNEKNVRISGGVRFDDIQVTAVRIAPDPRGAGSGASSGTDAGGDAGNADDDVEHVLIVEVNQPGDFSTYTLSLVEPEGAPPLDRIDPILRAIDFSFKVNCPTEFDCKPVRVCPVEPAAEPALDYLAKDYASLRQLMLDRLATLAPGWRERNPADLGIALVELLAYLGDYASYRQDAIATEAYLRTARNRVSVRRHARLVDYSMHDGCNARAWVHVEVEAGPVKLNKGTPLLTAVSGQPPRIQPGTTEARLALDSGAVIFETKHNARLLPTHNDFRFYTWGERQCCLPRGATQATLRGHLPDLTVGDVLILQEVLGPLSGEDSDADPTHRHAVRLTEVKASQDPIGKCFDPSFEPGSSAAGGDLSLAVTEIKWAAKDALPFPLCVSSNTGDEHESKHVPDVSIALGNIVLADHGRTWEEVDLGQVPRSMLERVRLPQDGDSGSPHDARREPIPPRFRPSLPETPVTQAAPYDHDLEKRPGSAYETMHWKPGEALPAITLRSRVREDDPGLPWEPRRDLLNSGPEANEFVVEVEADGRTLLRFGDGGHGARPREGARFTARYRVGNGERGNLGADALAHIVSDDPAIRSVKNPLPAQGGVEPESIEEVRQKAPYAFRTQERAVTPEDYATRSSEHPQVQRAAATLRWTGSWHTLFVSVDRLGGERVDQEFEDDLSAYLEPFRLAGHDLEIDHPRPVSLEIAARVRVKPGYYRGHVKAALLQRFSNRTLPDGTRGVFHPDHFTFGQTVYLSPLYAAAQAVDGVDSIEITTFQRQDAPGPEGLDRGLLEMGRLEIARLDNDPNYPARGTFALTLEGGK